MSAALGRPCYPQSLFQQWEDSLPCSPTHSFTYSVSTYSSLPPCQTLDWLGGNGAAGILSAQIGGGAEGRSRKYPRGGTCELDLFMSWCDKKDVGMVRRGFLGWEVWKREGFLGSDPGGRIRRVLGESGLCTPFHRQRQDLGTACQRIRVLFWVPFAGAELSLQSRAVAHITLNKRMGQATLGFVEVKLWFLWPWNTLCVGVGP